MLSSTLILMILSLFLGAGVWLFFIWAVKKGEFDDTERAKHRMLDDDDLQSSVKSTPSKPDSETDD